MARNWSHTHEAYNNAYENLHEQSRKFLCESLAEWDAHVCDEEFLAHFDPDIYEKAYNEYFDSILANDIIADSVWEKMSDEVSGMTCDNGGFNAWACPYGCHTVSFDRKKSDNGPG